MQTKLFDEVLEFSNEQSKAEIMTEYISQVKSTLIHESSECQILQGLRMFSPAGKTSTHCGGRCGAEIRPMFSPRIATSPKYGLAKIWPKICPAPTLISNLKFFSPMKTLAPPCKGCRAQLGIFPKRP